MDKTIAIYVRVSSQGQDFASQLNDLERWAGQQSSAICWYKDKASGTTMTRPAMDKLIQDIASGQVGTVVCWRLDRLGRTAKGLVAFFDELTKRKINLVSIKDGLDLSTPAGRLMANVLASVAAFETEARRERQLAGIAAAKKAGKRWGGSKPGRQIKVTEDKVAIVISLKAQGKTVAAIARAVNLSRPTIYGILDNV